jgi:hypothetical protein
VTNLFRLVHVHRWLLRSGLAALTAALVIPSDNFRRPRHLLYDAATAQMPEDSRPLRVQELRARRDAAAELRRLAAWADQHTPPDAVFIANRDEFRLLARRSLAASRQDLTYLYYLAPQRLDEWVLRLEIQAALFHKPTEMTDVAAFRSALQSEGAMGAAAHWYGVFPADVAPAGGEAFEVAQPGLWGRHYRLYRVPASAAEAAATRGAAATER